MGRRGRVLLRPPPPARRERNPSQGAVPGGAAASRCKHGLYPGDDRADAGFRGAGSMVQPVPYAHGVHHLQHRPARRRRTAPPLAAHRREAPEGSLTDAGRERIPERLRDPVPFPRTPAQPLCLLPGRAGAPGAVPAGGFRYRHVRRELQLARADMVPDECHADPGAVKPLCVLRE